MGADLYIDPLFDPNHERWKGPLDEAKAKRDASEPGSTDYKIWESKMQECYERMYSEGYFRDPYNSWSVLYQFGLSWPGDIIPLLDDEQLMSVEKAEEFLALLEDHEADFEQNLAPLLQEEQQFFRDRYAELQMFLATAIKLNCPVLCSL
jgi:hypothetical protein